MREFTVDGVKLVYEVHGEGPPVVLICGTGQPAATWEMFGMISGLTEHGYQVITFDNRGIPPSDVPPGPYTVEQMADEAIALLDHLSVGPSVVAGASLGGLITQTVALRRPDLVRAAVFLVGCGNFSLYARAQMQGNAELLKLGDPPGAVLTALSLSGFVPPSKWADEEAVEAALAVAGMITMSSLEGFAGQIGADLKWASENHVDELASLHMPALAIAHEFDCFFPPACVREAVARMPQGEYVEVPGASHVSLDPAHGQIEMAAFHDFIARQPMVASGV